MKTSFLSHLNDVRIILKHCTLCLKDYSEGIWTFSYQSFVFEEEEKLFSSSFLFYAIHNHSVGIENRNGSEQNLIS